MKKCLDCKTQPILRGLYCIDCKVKRMQENDRIQKNKKYLRKKND